jgi:aspartate/methionine/tyrosine aminotransferase
VSGNIRVCCHGFCSAAIPVRNISGYPKPEEAQVNPIYEQMGESIFARMSRLAVKHGAVNLGQGFPDFGWPQAILDAAAAAVKEKSNQYAPAPGLPELRQAVADHYNRHFGQSFEPRSICVTSGATEALASCILATVTPGDEVIIFTPAYDSYAPMIRRAGGVPVEIALQPPEWRIRKEALAAAITSKTRAILFNNPQNPTARLFDAQELQVIANAATEHDLVVIADEVWEHVLMDGQTFAPIATLPGMAARTLKIGSAGKIFSLTGWKIGWIAAAPELASLVTRAHQFLTFSSAPSLQWAVAFGMAEGDAWIEPMQRRFARARDRMTAALHAAGFVTLPSVSTYFLCVDLKASGMESDDLNFANEAVEKIGVAVIPLSVFYEQNASRHLVRLCFGKSEETIDAGVAAMAKARDLFTR